MARVLVLFEIGGSRPVGRTLFSWMMCRAACCAGQTPHHSIHPLAQLPPHAVVILQFHFHQNLGFWHVFAQLNSGCESQVLCVLPGACQRPLPSFERLNKYGCLTITTCLELFRLMGREGEELMWSPAVYHRAPVRGWGTALQSCVYGSEGQKKKKLFDPRHCPGCASVVWQWQSMGELRTIYVMWLLGLFT